ncbi:M20 family metallopeptidase [uncultured Thomasclavelia sp.]|uniref:M20 metallopeptidase family protein n=1 Tax=uncultured Thomasclavelia sp. TaxID=3025759 RepID=UPI0025DF9150|nr:M20 family metallopeptidase [uncultured Thomasclavelia sp.]
MDDFLSSVKKWRRDLHQIPEIGLQEYQTSAYLRQELEAMGYQPISVLETGLLVYLDLKKEKTVAFRTDMDALNITEKTGCDFASHHEGYMHACGHDGHMATMLGFAKKLSEGSLDFDYNILLIFQPAEESPGGANLICQQGILKKYHVAAIFGLHLMPTIEAGKIACRPGPLMAQNGELDVKVIGKSAHAGLYHLGVDSIVIASMLICQYQTILTRVISPVESCVINIGEIQGGTVRNIVPDQTIFKGTVRTYSEAVFKKITDTMQSINHGFEEAYGCKIEFSCPPMYPPVLNDYDLYRQFVNLAGDNYEELKEPVMLAEDFAFYQREVPGIFFYVGTKTDRYSSGLHTETFNFDEELLLPAIDIYYQIASKIKLGE